MTLKSVIMIVLRRKQPLSAVTKENLVLEKRMPANVGLKPKLVGMRQTLIVKKWAKDYVIHSMNWINAAKVDVA